MANLNDMSEIYTSPTETKNKVANADIVKKIEESGVENVDGIKTVEDPQEWLPTTPTEYKQKATEIIENPKTKEDITTLEKTDKAVKNGELPPHLQIVYEQGKQAALQQAEQEYHQEKQAAWTTEQTSDKNTSPKIIDNVDAKTS